MLRLINSIMLAIAVCVVSLSVSLSISHHAVLAVDYADCRLNFIVNAPNIDCMVKPGTDAHYMVYSGRVCATSPGGRCCLYNAYNMYCTSSDGFLGNYYDFVDSFPGTVCSNGHCVYP